MARYNPANNTVRAMLVILAPALLFAAAYIASGKFRNLILSDPPSTTPKNHSFVNFAAVILAGMCFSLFLPTFLAEGTEYDSFHEGESMGAAVSYVHGQTPFRDFIALHGLIQDPLRSAAAFTMFGRSIGAVRTLESILKMLVWAMLGIVILQICQGRISVAFIAISAAAFLSYKGGMTLMQRELPTLMTLSALLLTFQRLSGHKSAAAAAFLAGFAPVFGLIYSLERGIFSVFIAILGFGALLFLAHGHRKEVLGQAAGGTVLGLFVLAYFLRWDMASYTRFFLDMLKYKDLLDGLIYPVMQMRFLLYLAVLAIMLLYAAWLFGRTPGRGKQKITAYLTAYFPQFLTIATAIVLYRAVMGRADIPHLEYSTIGVILALFACVAPLAIRLEDEFMRKSKTAERILQIAIFTLCFSTLGWQTVSGKLAENFPVDKPDAEYLPKEYLQTTDYLRANMNESDDFLTMTNEAAWYYFLDKPCPIRFNIIMFAAPEHFQDEVISKLAAKPPEFVLFRNNHWAYKINGIEAGRTVPKIADFIRNHYIPDTVIGSQEIWRLHHLPQSKGK
ncbi:hypothetical protein MASR2M18_09840 [Ignavibacteria bacterium]